MLSIYVFRTDSIRTIVAFSIYCLSMTAVNSTMNYDHSHLPSYIRRTESWWVFIQASRKNSKSKRKKFPEKSKNIYRRHAVDWTSRWQEHIITDSIYPSLERPDPQPLTFELAQICPISSNLIIKRRNNLPLHSDAVSPPLTLFLSLLLWKATCEVCVLPCCLCFQPVMFWKNF